MRQTWAFFSCCIALFAQLTFAELATTASNNSSKIVYAGYNHLIVFNDLGYLSANVYDYHRGLRRNSSCSVFRHPALIKNSSVSDWLTDEHSTLQDLEFTFMDYELFMTQNKRTGRFVYRRCRDFQPGLGSLPCIAVAVGEAPKLKRPWTLSYIGQNRAILVNERTKEFGVYFFDPDVHSGGDPFHFSQPAIINGLIDFLPTIENTKFAVVNIPTTKENILMVHQSGSGRIQGYKFAEMKSQHRLVSRKVFESVTPRNMVMSSLGENQILLYDSHLNFEVWSFAANRTSHNILALHHYKGNIKHGHSCIRHDAHSCLSTPTCAWCPSTNSCLPYDANHRAFCEDQDTCSPYPWLHLSQVPPSPEPTKPPLVFDASSTTSTPEPLSTPIPTAAIPSIEHTHQPPEKESLPSSTPEVPHSQESSTPTPVPVEEVSEDEETGENDEPVLIHPDYRRPLEDALVVPVVPDFNNEVGRTPLMIEEDNPEDVIFELNRVAHGQVFSPPPPNTDPNCMDSGYSLKKAIEPRMDSELALEMMNNASPYGPKVIRSSPTGDVHSSHIRPAGGAPLVEEDCLHNLTHPIHKVNPTRDVGFKKHAPRAAKHLSVLGVVRSMEASQDSDFSVVKTSETTDPLSESSNTWMDEGFPQYEVEDDENSDPDFENAMNNLEPRRLTLPQSPEEHQELFFGNENIQDFIPLPTPPPTIVLDAKRKVVVDVMKQEVEVIINNPMDIVESKDLSTPILTPTPTPTPEPSPTPTPTPFLRIQESMDDNIVASSQVQPIAI